MISSIGGKVFTDLDDCDNGKNMNVALAHHLYRSVLFDSGIEHERRLHCAKTNIHVNGMVIGIRYT